MKKVTKTKQVMGLILIVIFGLVIWDLFIVPDKSDLFFKLWADDVQLLQKNKNLPSELNDVKAVSIQPLNQGAQQLIEGGRPPFKINQKGHLKLEVLLDVWQEEDIEKEEEQEGVYIQYNLMSDDGNTLWELSRTILLPKSSSLIASWFPELFEESSDNPIEDFMED